jgi:hypothetical protein
LVGRRILEYRYLSGGHTRVRIEQGSALRLGDNDDEFGARKDPGVHGVEKPE